MPTPTRQQGPQREQRDAIGERTAPGLPGQRAVEWLRALGEAAQSADVSKETADLMDAIHEQITLAGPEIVGVRLTAATYAPGLALALPEKVEMARPTGVARSGTHADFRLIPVDGADDWGAAYRVALELIGLRAGGLSFGRRPSAARCRECGDGFVPNARSPSIGSPPVARCLRENRTGRLGGGSGRPIVGLNPSPIPLPGSVHVLTAAGEAPLRAVGGAPILSEGPLLSLVPAGPGPRPAARRQARSGRRRPGSPGARRGGSSLRSRFRPPPGGRPGRRRPGRRG